MSEATSLLLSAAAGGLLGYLFFGALWLTIERGLHTRRGALWFAGGSFLRLVVALAGFYLLLRHDWRGGIAALMGFTVLRLVATLRIKRGREKPCT